MAQCQNNVTEWDIGQWCWWPGFAVGQHYKVTMTALSQVGAHLDVTLDVAMMENNNKQVTTNSPTPTLTWT